jgi:glycine cleavage system H protein
MRQANLLSYYKLTRLPAMNDQITFMDYLWLQIDDDIITLGINELGVEELDDNFTLELPTEDSIVVPNEVCGEIITEQGSLNLYSPIDGKIIEINDTVNDNQSLIKDDCYHDGWLFKIEVDNIEDLRAFEEKLEDDDE